MHVMGFRSQLSWMVKGRATTQSTLESLTADLKELQLKVEALQPRSPRWRPVSSTSSTRCAPPSPEPPTT